MDPEHYQQVLLAVTIVTFTLATITVGLRLISRVCLARHVFLDDWLIIVALLLAIGLNTTTFLGIHAGWLGSIRAANDQPSTTTTRDELHALLGFYNPAHALSKMSVLAYYLKLSRTDLVFRNSTIATMVLISAATLAMTILIIIPRGSTMDVMIYCNRIFLAFSPINIMTDMLIPLLPIPTVQRQLQLPRRQKLIVFATLGCGSVLTIVDILRAVYLQEIRTCILTGKVGTTEYLKASTMTVIWSVVDVNFSVVIPCIPALKPLVLRLVPRLLKSNASTEADATAPRHSAKAQEIEPTKYAMEDTISGSTLLAFSDMFKLPTAEEIGTASFASAPTAAGSPSPTTGSGKKKKKNGTDFGFYNLKQRSTLHNVVSVKQSIKFLWRTAILLLLIGFTTGFLEGVNDAALKIGIINSQVKIGNNSVFYGADVFGAVLFAYPIIKRWSFKGSSMTGMFVLACGCLTFWPSVVLTTLWQPVMLCYFVTGLGVSIILTGASLYCFLAGPGQYAASRILAMQVFQSLGSAIAPMVVRGAMEARYNAEGDIVGSDPRKTEWAYLVIACFAFLLMLYYQSLTSNEMRDDEIEERFKNAEPETHRKLSSHPATIWTTLAITILGMAALCGATESGHSTLPELLVDTQWAHNNLGFRGISQGIFTGVRLIAVVICVYVKPRWVLLACAAGAFSFSIVTMYMEDANTRVAFYLAQRVCQAPIWPIGFACACQYRGGRTRLAAVAASAAGSGAAVFSVIQWRLVHSSYGYQRSIIVPVVTFAVVLAWAIYLNVVPLARLQVDGPKDSDRYRAEQKGKEQDGNVRPVPSMKFITSVLSSGGDGGLSPGGRRSTMPRKLSQALSFMTRAKTASISMNEIELPLYQGASTGASSPSGSATKKSGNVAVDEVQSH